MRCEQEKMHKILIGIVLVVVFAALVVGVVNDNLLSPKQECYYDIETGEEICGDEPGSECVSGNDCSGSEICINGFCRADESSCLDYQGFGCSVDGNSWSLSDAGTCVNSYQGGDCKYSGHVVMDCGLLCQLGFDETQTTCIDSDSACMSDAGGNFVQDGTCLGAEIPPACDVSGHVAKDQFGLTAAFCQDGFECDSSVLGGDYQRDGYCSGTQCLICEESESVCGDGLDNDCDGDVDGGDGDCGLNIECQPDQIAIDTDGDGILDNCGDFYDCDNYGGNFCRDSNGNNGICIDIGIGGCIIEPPIVFDYVYIGNCNGLGGSQCDNTISSNGYVQDGICSDKSFAAPDDYCETSGYVFLVDFQDGGSPAHLHKRDLVPDHYWFGFKPNGISCDSSGDWYDGHDYSPDGMVTAPGECTSVGSTVRVDASDNNYFKAECDNSGDICDSSVSAHLTAPYSTDGVCENNICVVAEPKKYPI